MHSIIDSLLLVIEKFELYKDFFIFLQLIIGIGVFIFFEYHWGKKDEMIIYKRNPYLLDQYDKKILDAFKYFYAVVPFTFIYLFWRQHKQNFSTISFLNDYGKARTF